MSQLPLASCRASIQECEPSSLKSRPAPTEGVLPSRRMVCHAAPDVTAIVPARGIPLHRDKRTTRQVLSSRSCPGGPSRPVGCRCALWWLAYGDDVSRNLQEALPDYFDAMINSSKYGDFIVKNIAGPETQQQFCTAFCARMLRKKKKGG